MRPDSGSLSYFFSPAAETTAPYWTCRRWPVCPLDTPCGGSCRCGSAGSGRRCAALVRTSGCLADHLDDAPVVRPRGSPAYPEISGVSAASVGAGTAEYLQSACCQAVESVFPFPSSACTARGDRHHAERGASVPFLSGHCITSEVRVARHGLLPLSGVIRNCRCVIPSAVTPQSSRSTVVPGGLNVYSWRRSSR